MGSAEITVCSKCAFRQPGGGVQCVRCGVIFSKARSAPPPPVVPAPPLAVPDAVGRPAIGRRELWLLGGAALAAAVAHALPLTRLLLSPLVTLLHEFGHAVAAWALGCPALPAFDFVYGGGVTHHQNFQLPLAMFLGSGWLALGYLLRRHPRALVALAVPAALWLLAVSAEWRRELVISAMGHGAELIFAGVFLWMALSGVGWRAPEIERPLGAFIAFFVTFRVLSFAFRLREDPAFLANYMEGKGGAMMNDLEHVALDLKIWLGIDLSVLQIAGWMLVLAPLTLALATTAWAVRHPLRRAIGWLFEGRDW